MGFILGPSGLHFEKNVVDFESLHWFPTLSGWLVGWADWFAWFAWLVGLDSWLGSWLNWLIDWVGKMKKTARTEKTTQPPTTQWMWPGGMREAIRRPDRGAAC